MSEIITAIPVGNPLTENSPITSNPINFDGGAKPPTNDSTVKTYIVQAGEGKGDGDVKAGEGKDASIINNYYNTTNPPPYQNNYASGNYSGGGSPYDGSIVYDSEGSGIFDKNSGILVAIIILYLIFFGKRKK